MSLKNAVFILSFLLLSMGPLTGSAQLFGGGDKEEKEPRKVIKWGYLDSQKILVKMPDYQEVLGELAIYREEQQYSIGRLQKQVDSLQVAFDDEELVMTVGVREERLQAINQKSDSVATLRQNIFGLNGHYTLKKQDLFKDVLDRFYEATSAVSKAHDLQMLFDVNGYHEEIIYVNPIHDYSDYVLERLGLGDPVDVVK